MAERTSSDRLQRPNPPLTRRFTWRDTMQPETLISEDRGLRARAYGTLFLVGGALALLILVLGDDVGRNEAPIAAVALLAITLGMVAFVGYRRLPDWFFVAMTLAGTGFVTTAVAASSDGAEGVWILFYFWVTSLASLFFSLRFALSQVVLAVLGLIAVDFAGEFPFAISYLLAAAAVLGATTVIIALLRIRIERLAARLAHEAQTDVLTGLPNRRAFEERFAMELARADRSGEPLSVVVCDLDHFKRVNDSFGHDYGDGVLERAGRTIAAAVRTVDHSARMGGEEFGVVLPGAGAAQARAVAERIRSMIEAEFATDPVPLTISCGVATSGEAGEGRALIRAADIALYAAKQRGRNLTVPFEPGMRPGPAPNDPGDPHP